MYSNSMSESQVSLPNYVNSCTDSGVSSSDSLLNDGKRSSDGFALELAKLAEKCSLEDDVKTGQKDMDYDNLMYYKMSKGKSGSPKYGQESNDVSTSAIPRTSSVFLTTMDSRVAASDSDTDWIEDSASVSTASLNINNDTTSTSCDNPGIICKQCGDIYTDPRLLPCLHTFCLQCLQLSTGFFKNLSNASLGKKLIDSNFYPSERYFHSTALSNACDTSFSLDSDFPTITCSICQTSSRVPKSGVSGFPINQMKNRMVLYHQLKEGSVRSLTCDLCCDVQSRPSPMQGRCLQCSMFLCQFCIQAHKRQKPTANHVILDCDNCDNTEENVAEKCDKIPVLCNNHPLEELKLYCQECGMLVCRDCCLSPQHAKHSNKCVFLEAAICDHVDEIRHEYKKCEPMINRVTQSLKQVEQSEQEIHRRVAEVSEQIETHIHNYIVALKNHKKRLLQSLEEVNQKKLSNLSNQYQSLKRILNDLETSCEYTTELLGSGTEGDILSAKPYLVERLSTLSKINLNHKEDSMMRFVEFQPKHKTKVWLESNTNLQQISPRIEIELWGGIMSKIPFPRHCFAYGEGAHNAKVKLPSEFYVIMKCEDQENIDHGGDNVNVTVTPVHPAGNAKLPKVQVVDKSNGTYRVLYVVHEAGNYLIDVTVAGNPIGGSPFKVVAANSFVGNLHNGVFHCCSFCSSGGDRKATCGCGSTMPGGFSGCGHGHPGHPKALHWSCCGSIVESSPCPLKNTGKKVAGNNTNNYRTLPSKLSKIHPKNNFKYSSPTGLNSDESLYATTSTIKAQSSPYANTYHPNEAAKPKQSNIKSVAL